MNKKRGDICIPEYLGFEEVVLMKKQYSQPVNQTIRKESIWSMKIKFLFKFNIIWSMKHEHLYL